jgi:hypothetical protein
MTRARRYLLVFLAVIALLPARASAQELTGSLVGTVRDQQGGLLQGAVVRVTSPALIGGVQEITTNEKGYWRFPSLAPGTYVLTVAMATGFQEFKEEGIRVGPGTSREWAIELQLAGVTLTAEASSSLVRESGLDTRFRSDYIENIPTTRNSTFDLIRSAPGVSPTSPASRTNTSVSVFGSAVNENTFLIDGTNFTCPCQGVSRAEPIVDVIQEVHVQTAGASVEYGNLQGGVVNVVTKQGGNRFTWDTGYYGQWAGLTSQPFTRSVAKGTVPTSGYERDEYRDFTTNVGGPIKRGRAWFFGAYQYLRDYDSQPGTDPAFPRKYEQDKVFGKVTWKLSPSVTMMHSFHEEVWENPQPPTLSTPYEATVRQHATVPNSTFFHLTQQLSSNTVWEARAGRFIQRQKNDPASGDRDEPPRTDQVTGLSSGNPATIGGPTFDRWSATAVLNRYQPAWLGVDHTLKAGLQLERGQHQGINVIPGGVQYTDRNGQEYQAAYREPSIVGGRFVTASAFASDSFTLKDRVTIDAGIRFDHSNASSPDLPAIDAEGHETDGTIEGDGHLYTWNVLSPRLGLSAKLTGDARTMLRATYGRFNQGVLTGELDTIHPGMSPTTTMEWDPATGGYTKFVSTVDPTLNLTIDPNTRTPHTDEYSIAVDREIGRLVRASAAYVGKRGGDFIGWTDTGGQYSRETRPLSNGMVVPVWVLTNDTRDRRFLLTNPSSLSLSYDGLVVAMEKRMSRSWQASGSYTYSRTYGMQVTSNAPAAEAQFSTIARGNALKFGQDPNDLTNAEGRLPNDRPHIFRTTGVWQVPWQGLLVAANFQYFSGRPWMATTNVTLPQGSQRIMLETRGTRRLSSQSLLDLRVSKTLDLPGASSIDLLFDVLNLLNDTAEEALQTDNLLGGTAFGNPTQFMDPRRAMIGVRLNLGR